jgi:hypothetical protein
MPAFAKGGTNLTPFGRNQYLRSTKDVKFESYTCAAASVPARTIDGNAGQKILKPGTVMAKITTGGDAGKIGPFSAAATDGRQTVANIVGLNDTFLPWQLIEHDTEVAVAYECTAVQGWCIELDAASAEIPLTNTTRDAMRGVVGMDILFK